MFSVVDGDGDCRGAAREVIQPASPRLAAHQTVIQLETGVNICPYSCQSLAGTLLKILEFREDFLVV